MAAMFLSTITLLLLSAHATPTPVVRREQRQKQASLSSSGAVLAEARAHAPDQLPEEMTKIDEDEQISDQQTNNAVDDVNGEESEQTAVDFCNYDFPLGAEKSNNCSDSRHRRILDMGECRQAAVEAGAGLNKDFEVQYDWYNKHPEGCFKEKCSKTENSEETCYFYNPAPVSPTAIEEGTPVCKRPKLLIGTNNSNPSSSIGTNGTSTCPKDYEAVRIEAKCKEFGACMGHCIGTQFRINIENASLYNQYPKYCFIHADDKCVYFNEPREGMPDPTAPVGTPICNVSAITHFPAQQAF